MRKHFLLATGLITCIASVARAHPPESLKGRESAVSKRRQFTVAGRHPRPSSDSRKRRWYGWQTLAVDGVALGFAAIAARAEVEDADGTGNVALGAWLGTYALGGPIVHLLHQRVGAAVGSLGLRVGAPLTFAAIDAASENCAGHRDNGVSPSCGEAAGVTGFVIGLGAAIVLDCALLAYEEVAPPKTQSIRVRAMRVNASSTRAGDEYRLVVSGSF